MAEPTDVKVVGTDAPIPVKVINEELDDNEPMDRRQTIVPKPNTLQYLVAVVSMMFLGVAGVVAVEVLRPDKDNVAIDAALLGFLAPTTLSLLAFMKSQETHLSVNSRLDAFMAQARLAARAQGISQGRKEGRDSANARTDELKSKA